MWLDYTNISYVATRQDNANECIHELNTFEYYLHSPTFELQLC